MKKALIDVSYIIVILIMFILIFELLGMSLLSGNIHYQKFVEGFYTTYQVLTLENWNSLLYELWPMNNLCFLYFVVWIFLGNYILFNLFTSILLQSFGNDDENDVDDMTEDEIVEKMYLLPDYLYTIQKAEREHKILNSKSFRRQTQRETDFGDETDNKEINVNERDQSKGYIPLRLIIRDNMKYLKYFLILLFIPFMVLAEECNINDVVISSIEPIKTNGNLVEKTEATAEGCEYPV